MRWLTDSTGVAVAISVTGFTGFTGCLLIHAACQEAAVNRDDLPRHKTRRIRRKEDRGAREFVDIAEALHRRAHQKLTTTFSLVQQLLIERSAKNAGRDRIYADTATGPLDRQ